VRRGAAVVVTEGEPVAGLSVAQVLVPSVRVSLARLAGAFYGHPSRYLTLVGITGTNGKTTTSYLIDALLRARGLATGVIGTIQPARRWSAGWTWPCSPSGSAPPRASEPSSTRHRSTASGWRSRRRAAASRSRRR